MKRWRLRGVLAVGVGLGILSCSALAAGEERESRHREGEDGRALLPGGRTIAGPGLFKGQSGAASTLYYGDEMAAICVTLRTLRGVVSASSDGTLPPIAGPARTTVSACGDASSVALLCEERWCAAEWRIDSEGSIVVEVDVESIEVPPAEVQVVGVVGPTGPQGPQGPQGATGPTGPPGPAPTVRRTSFHVGAWVDAAPTDDHRLLTTVGSVVKGMSDTVLKLTWTSPVWADGPASSTCAFQLRIDGVDAGGNLGVSPPGAIAVSGMVAGGPSGHRTPGTAVAVFSGLAAGSHSIEIWDFQRGGASRCFVNPGNFWGSDILIEELPPSS